MASGCKDGNIATHFVLADSRSATPFVPTCCCRVSGDVVESTNYILKKGYNGHSSRGGGGGN